VAVKRSVFVPVRLHLPASAGTSFGATVWLDAKAAEKRTVNVTSPAIVLRLRGETERIRSAAGAGRLAVLGGGWETVELPADDEATSGTAPAPATSRASRVG
jgi:hypothetical protein